MKNHSLISSHSSPIRRQCAAVLLFSCLGALTLSAQSTSAAGSTSADTGGRSGSTATGSTTTGSSSPRSSDLRSDPTRGIDKGSSLKRADRKFITKAAESSEKEAAIAQLAAQRASSPDVRSFAQQLSSHHQKMHRELQQLAQRKGVTLDTMAMSGAGSESSTNAGIAAGHGAPRATGAAGTAGTSAGTGIETNASTATSGGATGATDMRAGGVSADLASDRHYRKLSGRTGSEFDQEFVDRVVDHHEDDVRLFEKTAKDAQDSDVRSFASNHLAALQAHLNRANSLMRAAAE